jgi:hypothetical protein
MGWRSGVLVGSVVGAVSFPVFPGKVLAESPCDAEVMDEEVVTNVVFKVSHREGPY